MISVMPQAKEMIIRPKFSFTPGVHSTINHVMNTREYTCIRVVITPDGTIPVWCVQDIAFVVRSYDCAGEQSHEVQVSHLNWTLHAYKIGKLLLDLLTYCTVDNLKKQKGHMDHYIIMISSACTTYFHQGSGLEH